MKTIETDAIETLLNIIGDVPEYQIVHFLDKEERLSEMLHAYCLQHNYLYQINCVNTATFTHLKEKYQHSPKTVVIQMPLERRSYKIQAREYQFMFVSLFIEESLRESFLEKAHAVIRSGGNIIILIEKKDYYQRDSWTALLEEKLYVSTSVMDDISEYYDVIISKRMHGWGI